VWDGEDVEIFDDCAASSRVGRKQERRVVPRGLDGAVEDRKQTPRFLPLAVQVTVHRAGEPVWPAIARGASHQPGAGGSR